MLLFLKYKPRRTIDYKTSLPAASEGFVAPIILSSGALATPRTIGVVAPNSKEYGVYIDSNTNLLTREIQILLKNIKNII